jgi:hypothetical protein
VSASWAICELIRGAERELQVVMRFPQAAYLAAGEELVALVTSDGIRHPNAVVLDIASGRRPLARLAVGRSGRVGHGGLAIGGLDLRVVRWWDPRPRLRTSTLSDLRAASDITRRRLRQLDGPATATHDAMLAGSVTTVVESLVTGDASAALAAAEACIGLGPGLTPSGDDRLAGLIAGTLVLAPSLTPTRDPDPDSTVGPIRVPRRGPGGEGSVVPVGVAAAAEQLGRAVSAAAVGRTTSVSVALLRHAARGQLAAPATELVRAWTSASSFRVASPRPELQDPTRNGRNGRNGRHDRHRGDEPAERDIVRATDGLLAVGSSSGRDLTLGLLAAVELLTVDLRPFTADRAARIADPCSRSTERTS